MKINNTFTLLFVLISFISWSQEELFFDNEINEIQKFYQVNKVDDGSILSAEVFNDFSEVPVIIKLDPSGETIWSTGACLDQPYFNEIVDINFKIYDSNYLYGIVSSYTFNEEDDIVSTLFKINTDNGEVNWILDSVKNSERKFKRVENLNESTILMGLLLEDSYEIYAINKENGELEVLDTNISANQNSFNSYSINKNDGVFIVDDFENIIFYDDAGLHKLNGIDFNNKLWTRNYSEFDHIKYIYKDKFGDIFLFNSDYDSPNDIIKIDVEGNKLWNSSAGAGTLSDIIDTNDYLYLTYRHVLVGGGSDYFTFSKISKNTGERVIYSANDMTVLGEKQPNKGGDHEAALGFDIDCSGDIYMTGYYGDANSGPGAFGIMKINGENGEKINDLTITNFPEEYDILSSGIEVSVFGENPNFFGYLEEENSYQRPVYVSTDSNLENVTIKGINSGYTYDSEVLHILEDDDHIYVLKQTGNSIEIEKYDLLMNKIWFRKIGDGFLTKGEQLAITPDYVYVAFKSFEGISRDVSLANLSKDDGSITNQVIIDETTNSGVYNYRVFELETIENTIFIFYDFSNTSFNQSIKFRKWNGEDVLSNIHVTYANAYPNKKNTQNLVHPYGENFYLYSNEEIATIDVNTLVQSSIDDSSKQRYNTVSNSNYTFYFGTWLSKYQTISKREHSTSFNNWSKNYFDEIGYISNAVIDNNSEFLYTLGIYDKLINIKKISIDDGSLIWDVTRPLIDEYVEATPLNISYNQNNNLIDIHSTYTTNNQLKHLVYEQLNTNGELVSNKTDPNSITNLDNLVFFNIDNDSFLVGGSIEENCTNNKKGVLSKKRFSISTLNVTDNSIQESDQNFIQIYPNPVSDILNISYTLSDKNKTQLDYSLIDINGKVILEGIFNVKNNFELDMSNLSHGFYFLNINKSETDYLTKVIKN